MECQCDDPLLLDRCIPALAGQHQVEETEVEDDAETSDDVTDETDSGNRAVRESVLARSVEEKSMSELQLADQDIGPVLRLRIQSDEQPSIDVLLCESADTKRLWNQWHRLTVEDNVLYRADRRMGEEVKQLIVPYTCRQDFLTKVHEGMCGGHLGIKKTLDQVQRRAYWTTWKEDVKRFCRRCKKCNEYHRGQLPRSAPLQPLQFGAPFERIHIDLTGPHPRSRRGSVYIVTIVEPFTKWAEALPVPNKEAATVARVLAEQFFCRFGIGIALLSDRGKEVDGNLMHEICRLLNIDKQHTTSYHSQCNAQCERLHRTLNAIIGRMLDTSERDWDMLLPYVMAAYRASRHEATGFTPNYLMLGRELRAPVDLIYGTPPQEVPATYDDYTEEVADRMRTAYSIVRDSLKRSAERNKLYYNLRVKPKQYQPGNWVYYYNPRKFKGKQ